MSKSQIIYLNGPSSSGKTTLTRALQDSFEEPFLRVGIDQLIGFMPAKMNHWKGEDAAEGFSWEPGVDPTGHSTYYIKTGPFAKRIVGTLKTIALLLASQGYNLIIDDVAFGAIEVEEWKQVLKDYNVLYVGVVAPLSVLEEREKARGDRLLGGARGQYFKVHENVVYDLEIDTYTQSMAENVAKIKSAIANCGE